jgi:predicted metal-dependent hydrolase
MRYLVRLGNRQYSPTHKKDLTMAAYNAVKGLGADIGNLRISKSAIELDLLLESETSLKAALALLEEQMGPVVTLRRLDVEEPPLDDREAIRLGIELFNEERYWESHEALEVAWRNASGDEKEILEGIILLAAALVHLQKDEASIALSVMTRAQPKLERHSGHHHGVELNDLKTQVRTMLASSKPTFFKLNTEA